MPKAIGKRKLRWGVLGLGKIASDFVKCLAQCECVEVGAIASRDLAKAQAFAEVHAIPAVTQYGDYAELAADSTLDVVYIATPVGRHVEDSLMCLHAGRAVLCEKTMAQDAEQAAKVIKIAKTKGLFFMHGVWCVFLQQCFFIPFLCEPY